MAWKREKKPLPKSIGLKALKKIGNPETSRTTMVTWPQGVEMSTHRKIGGGILKSGIIARTVYIPRPRQVPSIQPSYTKLHGKPHMQQVQRTVSLLKMPKQGGNTKMHQLSTVA